MRKILCFGNEFIEGDEVAKQLGKKLKVSGFDFVMCESPNEILNQKDEIIILDVVKNLKEVKKITKIDDLVLENSVTCHDLDLGFYLKLLKESGKINEVTIIGIPYEEKDISKLKNQITKVIGTL